MRAGEEPKHDRYHRNLYYAYFQPGNEHFYSADGKDLGVQIDNDKMEMHAKAVDTGEPKYARGTPGFPGPDVGYTHTVQPLQNGGPLSTTRKMVRTAKPRLSGPRSGVAKDGKRRS